MQFVVNSILIKQNSSLRPSFSLLFLTDDSNDQIYFSDSRFLRIFTEQLDITNYTYLNGFSKTDIVKPLKIISIKHNWDLFFIEFDNGCIFHIYYMMDSEDSPQQLSIYKPDDKAYTWAVEQMNCYEKWHFEIP
jgi:hypothetical protein